MLHSCSYTFNKPHENLVFKFGSIASKCRKIYEKCVKYMRQSVRYQRKVY